MSERPKNEYSSSKERYEQDAVHEFGAMEVADVNSGSPAEEAGVLSGDLIIEAQGIPIGSSLQLNKVYADLGDSPRVLTILRQGARMPLTIIPKYKDDDRRAVMGINTREKLYVERRDAEGHTEILECLQGEYRSKAGETLCKYSIEVERAMERFRDREVRRLRSMVLEGVGVNAGKKIDVFEEFNHQNAPAFLSKVPMNHLNGYCDWSADGTVVVNEVVSPNDLLTLLHEFRHADQNDATEFKEFKPYYHEAEFSYERNWDDYTATNVFEPDLEHLIDLLRTRGLDVSFDSKDPVFREKVRRVCEAEEHLTTIEIDLGDKIREYFTARGKDEPLMPYYRKGYDRVWGKDTASGSEPSGKTKEALFDAGITYTSAFKDGDKRAALTQCGMTPVINIFSNSTERTFEDFCFSLITNANNVGLNVQYDAPSGELRVTYGVSGSSFLQDSYVERSGFGIAVVDRVMQATPEDAKPLVDSYAERASELSRLRTERVDAVRALLDHPVGSGLTAIEVLSYPHWFIERDADRAALTGLRKIRDKIGVDFTKGLQTIPSYVKSDEEKLKDPSYLATKNERQIKEIQDWLEQYFEDEKNEMSIREHVRNHNDVIGIRTPRTIAKFKARRSGT